MEHHVIKEAENFDRRFPKLVETLDNFEKIINLDELRNKFNANKHKMGEEYYREIVTEFYELERVHVEA